MKLILHYMKRYKVLVALNILSVFGFALVELGIPTLVSNMIDEGVLRQDRSYLFQSGFTIAVISIVGVCGTILLGYCCAKISTAVTRDIRNDVFARVQSLSHAEMNQFGVSSLITRTNNDAYQIMMFLNVILRTALLTPVMIVVSFALTIRSSLQLSLIIASTIPIIVIGVVAVGKASAPISERQQSSLDRLNRIFRENLTGIRVIRSFNNDRHETERFDQENRFYMKQSRSLFKLMSSTEPVFFLVMNLAILAIVWFGGFRVDSGALTQGEIIAFVNYLTQISLALIVVANLVVIFTRAAASASRVSEVLSTDSSVTEKKNGFAQADLSAPAVEFQDVDFSIGAENILSGIRFQIHPGEMFGIIGSTGSGKSTIANLIERFTDATGGEVRVFGHNVKDYSFNEFRSQIGLVPQNAQVFTGTVRENLTMLRSDVTEEQLIAALKTAQAYDFVMERENGLDSVIEQAGRNLSGGQRQRLTIARALVARPRLLILDDSDSALDFATQQKLRTAIRRDLEGITVIVISQRVHSVRWCDQILVLDDGEAVGLGTHGELLRENEVYREICASQLDESEVAANE